MTCKCGCGQTTTLAKRTERGYVKGQPHKFIHGHNARPKGWLRKRPFEALYNRFAKQQTEAGFYIDLSYEAFVKFTEITECHYCGDCVTWTMYDISNNGVRYNLDRRDNNNHHYKPDNLVVCCKQCNYIKGNRFTYSQFVRIGTVIRAIREEQ